MSWIRRWGLTVIAGLVWMSCSPSKPAVPPGGPPPTAPGTKLLDDLAIGPQAGLPKHAVRRFGVARVDARSKNPTLHWVDRRRLLVIDHDMWDERDVARLWDLPTGRLLWFQPILKDGPPMDDHRTWTLDRKNHRLAFTWKHMRVVDLLTQKDIWRRAIPRDMKHSKDRAKLIPDGEHLLVPVQTGRYELLSLPSGRRVRMISARRNKDAELDEIASAKSSPGGRFLVLGGDDGTRIMEVRTGRLVAIPVNPKDLAEFEPLVFGATDEHLIIKDRHQKRHAFNPVRGQPYQAPRTSGTGKHRIIDRARAKLPLRLKLAPGEKIDVQSLEGPALFVRTNKRLLFIRADDSIGEVTGALRSTYLTGKGYWHRWTYHPRQQVLSAIQMWAPMLHLWRLPSGELLTARPAKPTLDTWVARQRVKWDVDNPADGKARRRMWLRSGERGEAAPDGRVGAVIADVKITDPKVGTGVYPDRLLVLRRTRDGAELWRKDNKLLFGMCENEHSPYHKRVAWSAHGHWLTFFNPNSRPSRKHPCGNHELWVLSRYTGKARSLWRSAINCGPAFAVRGTDFAVSTPGSPDGLTEYRRYDARTGQLRWRQTLPGRCHDLVIDTADRVLAVVEHPPMHYALVLVRPNRTLISLPKGLGLRSYFTPRGRYLHTAHIDSTEYLWRIPGWRSSR